ncbi:MAG: hypothetical protein ACTSQE_02480 [Candidatus Heimdallarchaeaceae archaeon]
MPRISRGSIGSVGRSISRSSGSFTRVGGFRGSSGWISRGVGVTSRRHTVSRHRSGFWYRPHYPYHRSRYYGHRTAGPVCVSFCMAPFIMLIILFIFISIATAEFNTLISVIIPLIIIVVFISIIFKVIRSANRSSYGTTREGYQSYNYAPRKVSEPSSSSYSQAYATPAQKKAEYVYCDNCGAKQKSSYAFCANCGAPLK